MRRARNFSQNACSARGLACVPLLMLASALPAAAQSVAAPTHNAAAAPDAITQRGRELEAARSEQNRAAEQEARLRAEIAVIGADRSKLNSQLIDIASQVRSLEDRIGETEARLRPLDAREQELRASLDSRRSEVIEVLAATGGNKSKAAQILGIERKTLYRKLERMKP